MHASEIPIASPCGADWRTMKPSDRKRFCDSCRKHVHDLSAMTKDEARAVLASPPLEGLCVRYLHDAHGDVLFQPAPIQASMLVRARRVAVLALAAALPLAATACMGATAPMPPAMMGAVACPMPPPPAPSGSASAVAPDPAPDPADLP